KVETDARGNVDVANLREMVNERTAGLMLTNPSTLGLFDERIEEIAEIFHQAGALLYYDGANLNAVCGISRPGDMGFDIVHINLHKTFSQPHGGGGPGGGPIVVRDRFEPYLPVPAIVRVKDRFKLDVSEALMIEPTETEAKETLDAFADAMIAIAREARDEPDLVRGAPHNRPVRRLDEVRAAKRPILKYGFGEPLDLAEEPTEA